MTEDATRVSRVARQQLETVRHFGVDFVPLRRTPAAAVEAKPDAAPPADDAAAADKAAHLETLRQRHASECPLCPVMPGATNIVFGEGNPNADLMFVGEGPGAEEDRTGRPFVGKAGEKLDNMIAAMGLTREQVYIANVVKARPPNNRTPTPEEMAQCGPFLAEQIAIIAPKVIVTLGGTATKYMLDTTTGITKLRGAWAEYRAGETAVPVMPTFHPAYLLRNYSPETRAMVWSDLQMVMAHLGLQRPGRSG